MSPEAADTLAPTPRALDAATIAEAFQATVADRAERPALRPKDSEFRPAGPSTRETVRRRAAGLGGLGVERGDTVGFMLTNRPGFFFIDTAAMHLGATCFSVYNTSSPEQIEYVVADAANRVIVTEPAFLDAGAGGARAGRDPRARGRRRWRGARRDDLDRGAGGDGRSGLRLRGRLAGGRARRRALPDLHLGHHRAAEGRAADPRQPDERAGAPATPSTPATPGGRSISYLPSAHIADRWASLYGQMVYGGCVHCCPDPREMVAYSIEVNRPSGAACRASSKN